MKYKITTPVVSEAGLPCEVTFVRYNLNVNAMENTDGNFYGSCYSTEDMQYSPFSIQGKRLQGVIPKESLVAESVGEAVHETGKRAAIAEIEAQLTAHGLSFEKL